MSVLRLGLCSTLALRHGHPIPSSALPADAPKPSWPSTRRPPVDPATFPPRTKPRWQNPRGVEPWEAPPKYPWLAKLQKYGHYTGVAALVGLTLFTGYAVYVNYTSIRSRRIAWERDHPEEAAKLRAEAAAKKKADSDRSAIKYGVTEAPTPTTPPK